MRLTYKVPSGKFKMFKVTFRHKYFKRPIIPVLQTVPPEV